MNPLSQHEQRVLTCSSCVGVAILNGALSGPDQLTHTRLGREMFKVKPVAYDGRMINEQRMECEQTMPPTTAPKRCFIKP